MYIFHFEMFEFDFMKFKFDFVGFEIPKFTDIKSVFDSIVPIGFIFNFLITIRDQKFLFNTFAPNFFSGQKICPKTFIIFLSLYKKVMNNVLSIYY